MPPAIRHVPTMRETMALHHTNPVCASCHKIFEPMGLALENFDATGTWRIRDGENPIDASGVLVDGTKVNGVADLRAVPGASVRISSSAWSPRSC